MWAISEARKMDLTRSLMSMAKSAGDTQLGASTYANFYGVDNHQQVKWHRSQITVQGSPGAQPSGLVSGTGVEVGRAPPEDIYTNLPIPLLLTTWSFLWRSAPQVVNIDVALERVMRVWFEQRHEHKRQLTKAIGAERGVGSGERLDFKRSGHQVVSRTLKRGPSLSFHLDGDVIQLISYPPPPSSWTLRANLTMPHSKGSSICCGLSSDKF